MLRRVSTGLICAAALASAASAQQVQVEEFVLDNGMEFLLVPRDGQPNSIAAGWVAKVGSVNERPGITGISHFFEHMMFKGTRTIGTRDAATDADLMAQLNEVHTRLRDMHLRTQYERARLGEIDDPWDPANDTPEMAALREELRGLMDAQKQAIVKDEFDQVYTEMGGSSMNAFTSEDVTFYFINVPSNKFELWAWMESDRLRDSVFREFYAERDVVHEERRLRTESTPTGEFDEQFDSMFWLSSPYHWPVVGWPSDLNSYTREQAEDYYNTYYRPNNLVGVVTGDFDVDEVKNTIERYFSSLERGPEPPAVVTREVEQKAEMRMYAEGDMQPQVRVRYHAVPFGHEDSYPLQVMSDILNGRTGRLYKAMVEGSEIASSAFARPDARKYAGAFEFRAETKGDATPEMLEAAWYEILADLQENPVGERELQKVKNGLAADSYRRLQSNFFLMVQLGIAEAMGGWEEINEGPRKLQAVTPEDIQRVANEYFDRSNRSVAIYTRSADAEPEDPALMALEPQVRQMVKSQLARIMEIEDVATLEQVLQQMSAQRAQTPEQFHGAIDYMAEKIRERIASLRGGE
jgi:predicted Zn-dependent peptidase